ncbi:MAG: penicillin-binding protein 2 [Desulfatiglandales bacterium]
MKHTGFDPQSIEILNKRLKILTLVMVAFFVVLFLRLWYLQLIKGPEYRVKSENNRIHLQDIPPVRGMIFDRHDRLLVDNRPSFDMYVIPDEVRDQKGLLDRLEMLVDLESEDMGKRLGLSRRSPYKPVLVKKGLTREELAVIESNLFNLPGVMIKVEPQRNYIYGACASHVIGYLGEISESQLASGKFLENKPGDLIGKYGLEVKWQNQLNGIRGGEQVEVDAEGRRLRVISRKAPVPGADIGLTIDWELQSLAEKALEDREGAVVVMDPGTGEILAMASSPSFDPNLFVGRIDRSAWQRIVSSTDSPLQNRAIAGQYPPGSIFKIVVALAGLEEGMITPEEEILCNGSYTLGRRTYRCWRRWGHGMVSLHRALVESCDVYFYTLGRRLGVDKIAEYAWMCGLGRDPGFDLDRDKEGLIPTSQWKLKRFGVPWQGGETVSTSIGQSFVLVTPLQAAMMISSVFNGGYLYEPKVVRWVEENGHKIYHFEPTLKGRLKVKPKNLEVIKDALAGVVNEPRGTGAGSRVEGVVAAGKTGTAQVVTLEREKSAKNAGEIPLEFRDHAWFVAIAPKDDPQLAVSVLIEHGGHGGSAAAPVAAKLIRAYMDQYQRSGVAGKVDGERKPEG